MLLNYSVAASIRESGFSRMCDVFSEDELGEVEPILDAMTLHSPFYRWLRNEMSDSNERRIYKQIELSKPSRFSHELRKSAVFQRCHEYASALLNCKTHYLFDHSIYKMPKTDAVTPWHQDQAYLGQAVSINSLHFWIPFQDCNEENGAMRFVAGSHRGFLEHHRPFNNRSILEVVTTPNFGIHEMVLSRGDISIHTNLTLHAAGANKSGGIRKAWIIHFGDRSYFCKRWMQVKSRFGS